MTQRSYAVDDRIRGPRSRVKHSTTDPLRSQAISVIGRLRGLRKFGIFIRLELYNTDAML